MKKWTMNIREHLNRLVALSAALTMCVVVVVVTPMPRPASARVIDGLARVFDALPPAGVDGDGRWHRAVLNGRQLQYRVEARHDDAGQAVDQWVRALPDLPSEVADLAEQQVVQHELIKRTERRYHDLIPLSLQALARADARRIVRMDLGSVVGAGRVRGTPDLDPQEAAQRWAQAIRTADPAIVGPARAAVGFDGELGSTLVEVTLEPGRVKMGMPILPGLTESTIDFGQRQENGGYRLNCGRYQGDPDHIDNDLNQQGWQPTERAGFYQQGAATLFIDIQNSVVGTIVCAALIHQGDFS